MATHNELGKKGEDLALEYLVSKGYTILHQNWRYKQYELDIVAKKDGRLHFVEVKTRSTNQYGYPEDSVTKKKFRFLQKAADQYLQQHPGYQWIRYDILSISFNGKQTPDFFLIEDVFL